MHLLSRIILILSLLAAAGCGSGGPLTPHESFQNINEALLSNDIRKIGDNITSGSRVKIETFRLIISRLDNSQIAALSQFYNYDAERLRNIDFNGALSLYFRSEGKNSLRELFSREIVALDIAGKNALLRLDNGVELDFKKEGPYWRFDLSDL